MNKLIALILSLACVISLVGCNNAEGNGMREDFVGMVTNINDDNTSYLVKVTDSGSSNLKVGDRVIAQMVDGGNVECSVGDYIKIEFNGVVEEIIAVSIADKRIPRVFAIEKIDITETDTE